MAVNCLNWKRDAVVEQDRKGKKYFPTKLTVFLYLNKRLVLYCVLLVFMRMLYVAASYVHHTCLFFPLFERLRAELVYEEDLYLVLQDVLCV